MERMTIHGLHQKLVNKEISAVELTQKILAHKDAVEPAIQAYLSDTREEALRQAEAVDKKIAAGEAVSMLAGIPGAIKDNICIRGQQATCGSKMLENFVAPYDATVIERLKQESYISLGKTNMDEFAMGSSTENSAYQITRNPWDTERVPGGSSGGSAAAVSAGTAVWSLGSDTGGSIRQPASFCGLVGMKPTYGRVSRYGLIAYASSLDQIGPITKDVTDCAVVMNAISGHDAKDSTSIPTEKEDFTKALINDVKGLKIGVPKEYFGEGLTAGVRRVMEDALETYKKLGAEIVEIEMPHVKYALAAYYIIAPAEASSNLARFDGVGFGLRVPGKDIVDMYKKTRTAGFGKEVQRRILLGNYVLSAGYYDAYYLRALKVRTLIKQDFEEAFKNVDIILTPAAPFAAFKIGEMANDPLAMYLSDVCTITLNLSGLPGISVPAGMAEGLPVGMQLIGRPLGEAALLQAAYTFEQNRPDTAAVSPVGEAAL